MYSSPQFCPENLHLNSILYYFGPQITYVSKFLAEFRFMPASIFMNNLSFMNLGAPLRDQRHSGKYVPITTSLSSKLMYILAFFAATFWNIIFAADLELFLDHMDIWTINKQVHISIAPPWYYNFVPKS